jgi:hypothetical protein
MSLKFARPRSRRWHDDLDEAMENAILRIRRTDDSFDAYIIGRQFAYACSDVLHEAARRYGKDAESEDDEEQDRLLFLQDLRDALNEILKDE